MLATAVVVADPTRLPAEEKKASTRYTEDGQEVNKEKNTSKYNTHPTYYWYYLSPSSGSGLVLDT